MTLDQSEDALITTINDIKYLVSHAKDQEKRLCTLEKFLSLSLTASLATFC